MIWGKVVTSFSISLFNPPSLQVHPSLHPPPPPPPPPLKNMYMWISLITLPSDWYLGKVDMNNMLDWEVWVT